MSQTWKIVVAVIITAIVVGGGFYFWWQQNKKVETPKITQETETQTPTPVQITETEKTTEPTTDKTQKASNNSWKTNENPLGMPISYQYPGNWTINKHGNIDTGAVSGENGNPVFEIFEERELNGLTPKQAFEKKRNTDYEAITFEQATQITGKDAYKIQGQALPSAGKDYGMGIEKIYVKSGNKIYAIQFVDFDKKRINDSSSYSTYQQILSTILFSN
ncbi:hypothetical protein KKG51_01460 [Patescibacteria group bacterium]|nr:hypothetical protein [Patescibacteria group bacterium]